MAFVLNAVLNLNNCTSPYAKMNMCYTTRSVIQEHYVSKARSKASYFTSVFRKTVPYMRGNYFYAFAVPDAIIVDIPCEIYIIIT